MESLSILLCSAIPLHRKFGTQDCRQPRSAVSDIFTFRICSSTGVPLHVVSARAGHANASVTLNTYAHLMGEEDERAAEQADKLFESIRERK